MQILFRSVVNPKYLGPHLTVSFSFFLESWQKWGVREGVDKKKERTRDG